MLRFIKKEVKGKGQRRRKGKKRKRKIGRESNFHKLFKLLYEISPFKFESLQVQSNK